MDFFEKTPITSKKFLAFFAALAVIASILIVALLTQSFSWQISMFMCIGIIGICSLSIGYIISQKALDKFLRGLQKINFGPAKIMRSLMWFDRLDIRDLVAGLYYFTFYWGTNCRQVDSDSMVSRSRISCRWICSVFGRSAEKILESVQPDGAICFALRSHAGVNKCPDVFTFNGSG